MPKGTWKCRAGSCSGRRWVGRVSCMPRLSTPAKNDVSTPTSVPDEREQRQVGEHVALDGPDAVVEDKETAREPVDGMQEEVVRTVPAKYHSEVVSRKMDEAARRMMRRRRCSTRCAEVTASDGARALKTVLVDTHPLLWIESPMRRSLWIIAYRARSVDTSFKR